MSRFFRGEPSTLGSRIDEMVQKLPIDARVDFYLKTVGDDMEDPAFWNEVVRQLTPKQKAAVLLAMEQDVAVLEYKSGFLASEALRSFRHEVRCSDRLAA